MNLNGCFKGNKSGHDGSIQVTLILAASFLQIENYIACSLIKYSLRPSSSIRSSGDRYTRAWKTEAARKYVFLNRHVQNIPFSVFKNIPLHLPLKKLFQESCDAIQKTEEG